MERPPVELSAVSSALAELQTRIGHMAEQASAAHDDHVAAELFAVERALVSAGRRLNRLVGPKSRRR